MPEICKRDTNSKVLLLSTSREHALSCPELSRAKKPQGPLQATSKCPAGVHFMRTTAGSWTSQFKREIK